MDCNYGVLVCLDYIVVGEDVRVFGGWGIIFKD